MRAGVIPACIMKEWNLPAGIITEGGRFRDLCTRGSTGILFAGILVELF